MAASDSNLPQFRVTGNHRKLDPPQSSSAKLLGIAKKELVYCSLYVLTFYGPFYYHCMFDSVVKSIRLCKELGKTWSN